MPVPARSESGQGLIELLVALLVGGIVLGGIMEVSVGAIRGGARVTDKVESTQLARSAVNRLIGPLNSQVCADALTPPIVVGSTRSTLTFYSDQAPATANAAAVRAFQYKYDPGAATMTIKRWPDASTSGTPTYTRVINDVQAPAAGPFSYDRYSDDVNAPDPTTDVPVAAGGLTSTQVALIVGVQVDLTARTRRSSRVDGASTTVSGNAYVQSLDPLDATKGPRCAA